MAESSINTENTLPKQDYISSETSKSVSPSSEITTEQHQKMQSLKKFFRLDDKIKESLQKSAPPHYSEKGYGEFVSYEKKLNNGLTQIPTAFEFLAQNMSDLGLSGNSILEKCKTITSNALQSPQWDFDKLKETYSKYFSSINPELVKEISGNIIGYYMFKESDFSRILSKVTSFTELLHLAHSSVLADENLFSKLPKWDTTETEDDSNELKYNAYGEQNEHAKKIFTYLKEQSQDIINDPEKSESTEVPTLLHLLSVDNTIQLMVRDFGHALTIEIDTSNPEYALFKYNIPKIWDGTKINQLPGIEKVNAVPGEFIDRGAYGRFELSYTNLAKDVFDFILQVPTDSNH